MRSVVEILVECSPAMQEPFCGGRTKLDVVKDSLKRQVLPRIMDRLVGVRTFGECCRCPEGGFRRAPQSLVQKAIPALIADIACNGLEQPAVHLALESCLFALYESGDTRELSKHVIIFSSGKNRCGVEGVIPSVANAVPWVDLKRTLQERQDLKISYVVLGNVCEALDLGDEEIMSRCDMMMSGSRVLEQNLTVIEGFLAPLLGTPVEQVRGVDRFLPIAWGQRRLEERFDELAQMQYEIVDGMQRVRTTDAAKSGFGPGGSYAQRALALLLLAAIGGVVGGSVLLAVPGGFVGSDGVPGAPHALAPSAPPGSVCALSEIEAHCKGVMDRAVEKAMRVLGEHNQRCSSGAAGSAGSALDAPQQIMQSIQDVER
jgi:hypothetical protein